MEYQSIGGQAPASLCLRAFSSAVYRPPSDRSLLEYPPDILAYTRALPGSRPKKIQKTKQDGQKTVSFCLVEHRGLDRPHRFACVLPPRRSIDRHRTARCSNIHRIFSPTLAPSRVLAPKKFKKQNKTVKRPSHFVWWSIGGSNP